MNSYITIGVTGGIGSGKSIICRILTALGYPVFYSDDVAKELLNSDPELKLALSELLGLDAYIDGKLNRPYVAERIFSDEKLKEKMNSLVHPAVRKAFQSWSENQASQYVFNEAAILFETGAYKNFDKTILVTSPMELRISRVMARDNCDRETVEERMSNQWPDEDKAKLADFIIHNDEEQMIIPQVLAMLVELPK